MDKTPLQIKKSHVWILILSLALVFSLIIEFGVFMLKTVYSLGDDAFSVINNDSVYVSNSGYNVEGDLYTPTNGDPQIVINNVNKKVKNICVFFGEELKNNANLQVFYIDKQGYTFVEENSESLFLPVGVKDCIITLTENEYSHLRFDINGQFVLADIVASSQDLVVTSRSFTNFNFFRFLIVFALFVPLLFLVWFFIIKYAKKRALVNSEVFEGSLKEVLKKHPVCVLLSMLLVCSTVIFANFLFGERLFIYTNIGGDDSNIYYPFYMLLQRKLAAGDFSLWDFSCGFGTNILSKQAEVGSVFTYLIISFGSPMVRYMLPVAQILKIILSGYLCYLFLSNFKYSDKVKVIVSFIFALNGFTMLWGQHYFFATACLCAVFVLFGVEKALQGGKGYLCLAISTAYVAINSYYFAYMVLILAGIYALLRIIYIYNGKQFLQALKKIGLLFCSVLLGLGISAVIFIPSAMYVLSTSSRLSSGTSLFEAALNYLKQKPYGISAIKEILARIVSNNLNGTYNYSGLSSLGLHNYYESPQFFFSSFTMFFFIAFTLNIFFNKEEKLKVKIIKAVVILLCVFTIIHPFMSFIINGFVQSSFRYTFLLMPIFALMYSEVLENLFEKKLKYPKLQITISGVLSVGLTLYSVIETRLRLLDESLKSLGVIYLVMVVVIIAVFILLQIKNLTKTLKTVFIMAVCLIFCANVVTDGFVTTNHRITADKIFPQVKSEQINANLQNALTYLRDTDKTFYRVEKTWIDVAHLNDSMLEGFYGASTYNSVINSNVIRFTNNIVPEFDNSPGSGAYFNFANIYDKNLNAVNIMGVKYILTKSPITTVDWYEQIAVFGNVYVYKNPHCNGIASVYSNAMGYEQFESLDSAQKSEVLKNTVILEGVTSTVSGEEIVSQINFLPVKNSNYVEGSVTLSNDGYLMVSIPCENGWSAYVDGVKTEIISADYAFSAIKLSAGEHEIEFRYTTPYIKTGGVISIVSVAIFVTTYIVIRKKTKENGTDEKRDNSL